MSGIITGSYFRKFFNEPTALELGSMVAILEVGAFGMPSSTLSTIVERLLSFTSHISCCWSNRGFIWPQGYTFHGRRCIHSRWHGSDLYDRILVHDNRPFIQRFWCRSLVVCVWQTILSCWLTMIVGLSCRFIKAKSPQPTMYVSSPSGQYLLTQVIQKRGALACMEFTGNIIGYASSVVCHSSLIWHLSSSPFFSGQDISALSLNQISRGGFLFLFSVVSGWYWRLAHSPCLKVQGQFGDSLSLCQFTLSKQVAYRHG